MCVNDLGHIFVAWIDDRNGSDDLWMNRSTDRGDSWLVSDVQVDDGGDAQVSEPVLACEGARVWLAWEDDRDGELDRRQIYLARSADFGQSFSAEIVVDGDYEGENMSLEPRIAVDGERVHVAWYDDRNGAYDIFVASSEDAGATFGEPVRVDADGAGESYSAMPTIAAENGQVFVAWEDSRHGSNDVVVACSENGGRSFGKETRLDTADSPGLTHSFQPIVKADGGHAHVVWNDEVNGVGNDVFIASGSCNAWGPATRVDDSNAGFFESRLPTLEVSGATAHVAWTDNRNGAYDVFYRRVEAGIPVGEEVRLDVGTDDGASHSIEPALAFNPIGEQVVVAWNDGRADFEDFGYDDIFYNHASASGPFAASDLRIDTVDAGVSFKTDLQIAITGRVLFAAWSDGRNGTADVYFHRVEIGDGWVPPQWE